ncbi:MAG TPA: hypothetical protein VGJ92_10450 [Methanocella sp.]
MRLSPKLFILFIKEEFRAQSSMFHSSFLMYPLFIFVLAGLMGLMLLPMKMSLSKFELVTLGEAGVFMAGMLVGGMGMFMDMILEKRMGSVRMLLSTPATLPVAYKEFFAYFYFKDMLYYMLMDVLPVLLGIYASTLLTGLQVDLPMAAVTLALAFALGMAVAFALSTVVVRSRSLFAVLLVGVIGLSYLATVGQASALYGIGRFFPPVGVYMSGSLADLAISIAVVLVLCGFSLFYIREMPHPAERHFRSQFLGLEKRFRVFGQYASLAAKEWTDLRRSGGLGSVLFSFILPLLFLWGLLWMMSSVVTFMSDGEAIALPFDTMFYAIIIGFFGSLVYGWLNNLDNNGSYRMLPVTMTDVIKAKLILFVILNTVVSVAYLGLISLTRGEIWPLLPVGLYTMFMVSGYTGVLTAYMTGVFTNSLMFDYKVMTIYSLAVAPALIVLIVLSFSGMLWAAAGLATLMGLAAYFLLGRIDGKWGHVEFRAA